MLQGKEWKSKFSLIILFLLILITLGCQLGNNESTSTNKIYEPITNELNQLEELRSVKFALSEKYLMEGIFWYDNTLYYRALYSLTKSFNFNPLSEEVKFFLAKAYLNAGYIRNAIDLLSEIEGKYKPYAIQKISSIYSRLSIDESTKLIDYSVFTNLKALPRFDTKIFSLATTIKFVPKLNKVIFNSFGTKEFCTIDNFMRISKYKYNKEIIDIYYDENEKVFYILGYNSITKYYPGWFNLNIFNINAKKTFKFSNVVFKKFAFSGENIFVIDSFSKNIFVINKETGEFLYSFGSNILMSPTDIEVKGDNVFVADTGKIIVFDKYGNYIDSVETGYNINGFSIASSNFLISTDNGIFLVSPSGESIKISDGEFEDACINNDKDIFAITKDKNNISVLRNSYLMSANLDVDIKGIFVGNFPIIGVMVGVRDSEGNFISGLRNENFEIYESGVKVFRPDVRYTYEFLKNRNLYIIIENSPDIQNIKDSVLSFVRGILEDLSSRDYISISVFGPEIKEFKKTRVNVLAPLDFLDKNITPSETNKVRFSLALHNAITENLTSLRNNAILVITSGNENLLDYSDYDFYTLLEYSYNNFIPIYVISLSNNEKLQILVNSTGGKYYSQEVLLSPRIFLNDFYNLKIYRYFLIFTSLYENLFPENKLVELEVRVNYKGVEGTDIAKYLFPKIKRKEQ